MTLSRVPRGGPDIALDIGVAEPQAEREAAFTRADPLVPSSPRRSKQRPGQTTRRLADAIPLDQSHRLEFIGGHSTAALWLPVVIDHFTKTAMR